MRWLLTRVLEWIWYRRNPLKWLLWPLSWVYRAVVRLRQVSYRVGLKSVTTLPVPVIIVGNITVGGTGKTPCVIWLARELTARGIRVGVVSRGYGGRGSIWPQRVEAGSDPAKIGDEPVLIARATDCRVVVGPNRVAAARSLLDHAEVDLLLCDDGLQHYALARDMEIAVVDGQRGLGNGLCLPAGPLREPAARLRTVDAVLVNGGTWYYTGVLRVSTVPERVYQLAGAAERSLQDFRDEHVHAVTGIGNPQRFFDLLTDAGLIVRPHSLPDHAHLKPSHLKFRDQLPVLITEKDAVKCESFASEKVWCVAVAMKFEADHGERLLERVLARL